jgi:hypothetical protein
LRPVGIAPWPRCRPLGRRPGRWQALRALPLRALPLRALPLRALPLRALPLRALPLRALPLRDRPSPRRSGTNRGRERAWPDHRGSLSGEGDPALSWMEGVLAREIRAD